MATAGQGDSAAERPAAFRLGLPQRLPPLEGSRAAAIRIVYVAVAFVALIVIAGSFWFNGRDYFGNMPTAAAYGFRTATTEAGPRVAGVSGADARASGLQRHDQFVAIGGRPVPKGATEFTVAEMLSAQPGGEVIIVTRSADGSMRTHQLTRRPVTRETMEALTRLPLWLFIALGFVSTQLPLIIWFAASLLLARRRPRDPEAMLFAFGFLLMSMNRPAAFWLYAVAGVPALLFEGISNFGACLLLAAIAGFPDGRFQSIVARITFAASALLAALVPVSTATDLPIPTGLLFLFCTFGALASVWLRYRRTGIELERQQIKWAVFSFCAALALLVPMQVGSLLDLTRGDGPVPYIFETVVPNLALLLMAGGLLVSLLRYRLYDADAAISRSAGYALLTLMLAATFAAGTEGMEWFFQASLGREGGALPGAIAAGLAVALITPLHSRVHGWAERRFQRALQHLRRDLPECVSDMRETSSLPALLAEVVARVTSGVRASRAAIIIRGEVAALYETSQEEVARWKQDASFDAAVEALDCDRSDPLFPMRVPLRVRHGGAEPIGWILLGPRPDGSAPGKDEQEALAEIADPVARAVQIVLMREERQRAQEDRLTALEAAVAELARTQRPGKSEPLTGAA